MAAATCRTRVLDVLCNGMRVDEFIEAVIQGCVRTDCVHTLAHLSRTRNEFPCSYPALCSVFSHDAHECLEYLLHVRKFNFYSKHVVLAIQSESVKCLRVFQDAGKLSLVDWRQLFTVYCVASENNRSSSLKYLFDLDCAHLCGLEEHSGTRVGNVRKVVEHCIQSRIDFGASANRYTREIFSVAGAGTCSSDVFNVPHHFAYAHTEPHDDIVRVLGLGQAIIVASHFLSLSMLVYIVRTHPNREWSMVPEHANDHQTQKKARFSILARKYGIIRDDTGSADAIRCIAFSPEGRGAGT